MANKNGLKMILASLLAASIILTGCNKDMKEENGSSAELSAEESVDNMNSELAYSGPYSAVNGTYGGVDDLGRTLTADDEAGEGKSDRYVGIFYFLWQGEHGTGGPYDNTEIVASDPNAISSEANWIAAGGGGVGEHHFWGEPLFGYYTSSDTWVMRKHVQMLTDAGVDFVCFDTTNAFTYTARVKELISVWYEYMEQGYKVPKLVFYTNSSSGATMNTIYHDIYMSEDLKAAYPRLDELWFNWDGKPLIIGDSTDPVLSDEAREYFRIKANQWPNENKKDDGFPWMEFSRALSRKAVYGLDGRKEVMNVSIAQHNATCTFSYTAWYGFQDRTRSYHKGGNDTAEDAYLYGYNFAEQWRYAIKQDPEMVFVTGWNEWVAQRQPARMAQPIVFVDCADYNTSRDAEPMRGYFGDNYYMQLIDYIRKYKGAAPRVYVGDGTTIDMMDGFEQWDSEDITAVYTDYKGDTADRNATGFGGIEYVNTTGRNDIVKAKVTRDSEYLYFYVETAEALTPCTDDNWMTLFLRVGKEVGDNWYGYNYAVNVESPTDSGYATLYRCTGGWNWEKVSSSVMKIEEGKLMLAVPRADIGAAEALLHIEFKWADNYTDDDIWSFYTDGDTAPYGRLNYVYSNMKTE